jgi:predicted ATPase/class 3 adenylate cyclase
VARELPSGTVTFLFTDVEGSTKLLGELGPEGYAEALGEHRSIVRDALATHGGVEVDTQGDAFFCAFGSARSAVVCAAEIQERLASGPIRVRMGVHTGEALVVDGHYVGMDVHRAARIGACGHGGQVVLSPSTVALLEPGELAVRELGPHRLKDLTGPVVLSQLGHERFTPLRTLFRTNLPVPATPFLGREPELGELVDRASEPGLRALTLTGPGGTGKTRLALQLSAELSDAFPDGVWWVPLAPLRDGAQVSSALAGVLEVEEETGRPLVDSIGDALLGKRVLLLLDNCEHLLDAAAALTASLVAACPDTLVLATSREALAIQGEQVFPVEPLAEHDAVDLFLARARAAGVTRDLRPERDVVAELCRCLDSLPLAVELAAARTATLPPSALLDRLSSRLDLLTGPRGVEERQRTLRATIAWSYGLLEDAEQRLFRRLAVFVGGAELSAIETVCEAELEEALSLVAKSLLRQAHVDVGGPRYFVLETIREFASEELDASGERRALEEHHLELFARLAQEFVEATEGEASGSGEWLARIEHDLSNLRAAFAFATEADHTEEAIALAMALWLRHFARGRYSEAVGIAELALDLDPEPLEQAWLREALGRALRLLGRPGDALESFEVGEEALRAVGSRDAAWWERWVALEIAQATLYYFENRPSELARLIREIETVVPEHGTPMQALDLLHLRTQHAYRLERYAPSEETEALARETYRRAVELDDAGADFMLGFCLLWRGELEEAEEHFVQGCETGRARGIALIETRCLVYGTVARRRRNDVEGVREWLRMLEAQDELHGYRGLTAANAAWLAYRDGALELAVQRGREALADWQTEGLRGSRVFEWTARFPLLGVALAWGELEAALEHARAMLDGEQQPLPEAIAAALTEAMEDGGAEGFERALGLARASGYA